MDAAGRYLEIVLRLRRLSPELVESYRGPSELAARVEAEPPPSAQALRADADALQQTLEEDVLEEDRRTWLSAQLAGIDAALAELEGERFGYRALVERCYGVTPALASESRFAEAHEQLAQALPGSGDVRSRYQAWAAGQRVQPAQLSDGLDAVAGELRRRTRELVRLPAQEEVSFELVSDELWAGNADFLGSFHTHVQINADLPISSGRLLELVSHEAYAGHHTEHVCKEAALIGPLGRVELAVYVYCTPQALIAEGIAMLALEVLLGELADETAAAVLRPLGIVHDQAVAGAERAADMMLLPLRANIAMMLDDGCPTDEARAYARRWMLEDDSQVEHAMKSLTARRWMPYESCYPEGLALCRRFTAADPARFRRLLEEQLTTADLLAELS